MGRNFKIIRHGKVGDIVYPAYNGTNCWWKESRWDLITKVNGNGVIIGRQYIWDYATVRAIELIQLLHLNLIGNEKEEKSNGK